MKLHVRRGALVSPTPLGVADAWLQEKATTPRIATETIPQEQREAFIAPAFRGGRERHPHYHRAGRSQRLSRLGVDRPTSTGPRASTPPPRQWARSFPRLMTAADQARRHRASDARASPPR